MTYQEYFILECFNKANITHDNKFKKNDKVVINQITLESDFKEIFIELQPGFNKIEFEALNQGESGPNTAQFVVVDDRGVLVTSNKWNLTTGVKAKIIVVKEEMEKK